MWVYLKGRFKLWDLFLFTPLLRPSTWFCICIFVFICFQRARNYMTWGLTKPDSTPGVSELPPGPVRGHLWAHAGHSLLTNWPRAVLEERSWSAGYLWRNLHDAKQQTFTSIPEYQMEMAFDGLLEKQMHIKCRLWGRSEYLSGHLKLPPKSPRLGHMWPRSSSLGKLLFAVPHSLYIPFGVLVFAVDFVVSS